MNYGFYRYPYIIFRWQGQGAGSIDNLFICYQTFCLCNNGVRDSRVCVCLLLVDAGTQEHDWATQKVCISTLISPGCISAACHQQICSHCQNVLPKCPIFLILFFQIFVSHKHCCHIAATVN